MSKIEELAAAVTKGKAKLVPNLVKDCLAEGIVKKWYAPACRNYFYIPNVEVKSTKDVFDTPREAYASLIDKVGKKGDWESNPYVFVYDFELIK